MSETSTHERIDAIVADFTAASAADALLGSCAACSHPSCARKRQQEREARMAGRELAEYIATARAEVEQLRKDLAAVRKAGDSFKEKSESAYCLYLDRLKRPDCLGADAKMAYGTFTTRHLLAHNDAQRALGEHRALMYAYNALGRALAAQEGA